MRLKEEYKDYKFDYNGATYITSTFKEETYKMIWDQHPRLRYLFEEEDKEKEFFKGKPEGITEEEYFEDAIKKAVKKKTTTKKK